jgi:exodeoxyribonuclease VII large subunit
MTVSSTEHLTVTQLNRFIRHWLEQDLGEVRVEGEISNATHAASGHCYFTLKDAHAQLRCVYFRNRKRLTTPFVPANGQYVLIKGMLSIYEARGDYQLIVDDISETGLGPLHQAFLQLKAKLNTAGLFDIERKQSIPSLPRCIGIITSPKGAALHDILTTLKRRYPLAKTKLYPCEVQGNQASLQLINALTEANQQPQCDVLILARGGGSLEDLWPFNNEQLAYAIADSTIPSVTGIGHETDFTIADFVADFRAATPTAAAEKVTPDWTQLLQVFQHLKDRLQQSMQRTIQSHWQNLDSLTRQLQQLCQRHLTQKKHELMLLTQALDRLSPTATLLRGYAIVTHHNTVVLDADTLQCGDTIHLELARGQLTCLVSTVSGISTIQE